MTSKQKIDQELWDELEDWMGEKLSKNPDLYEEQLQEIIIEFMGCMTEKKHFLSTIKVAVENLETWAHEE